MGQSNWKHTRNWTSFRYRDTDAEAANMAHSTQILAVLCVTTLLAVVLGLPAENLPRSSDSFDPETDDDIPADVYINHEEMTAWMQAMALRYPELASLKSVGKSVQGRDLWAMELSRSVERGQRDLLMPMMKLVGNIHGNEVVGRHVLLRMISYLITKEGSDERIAQLLNTTDIFIMPTMNPDGFSRAQVGDCYGGDYDSGRPNENSKDLNRDFPDQFKTADTKLKTREALLAGRQPETQAMMKWIMDNPFVLSMSMHGGAVVASYPFDSSKEHLSVYSASPDDDVFKTFSKDYADRHPTMQKPDVCGAGFKDGITNGADWYDLVGGMQDFNYVYSNCFEITMEMSCCKYPEASELPTDWEHNRRPILNYIASTHRGVRGLILEEGTQKPVPNAYVVVEGIDKNITSTERGEYWRLLVPGSYKIQSFADGYHPSQQYSIEITDKFAELQNFEMRRKNTVIQARLTCN